MCLSLYNNPDLSTGALGRFQWIELHHFLGAGLDVGCEIAGAVFPFGIRIGAGLAVNALLKGQGLATTLAGFDDRITDTTVEGATLFTHEKAFCTLFDRLTEHLLSPLYLVMFFLEK